MLPQEIIRQKRDGAALSADAIKEFITGVTDKTVSEGQVAAFCMAVLLNKMNMDERVALTSAMAQSGTVIDWASENLSGPVIDKHSSGGVGDKVSLMLAPIIAACGGFVPMISGRGLGHTGGTLDKMDSIPGYVSQPDLPLLKKAIHAAGCAVIGATSDIAPADRIIYAIRDTTGTVESLDLITASILSKKLAAGLDGLVMDVKFGSGAFMKTEADAKALAQSIISVANGAGLPTVGILTDMNQVLGYTAGNAVEVAETIEFLKNENVNPRLYAVTDVLCAEMLVLGKLAADIDTAKTMIKNVIENGKALEHFSKMVTVLGGPADFVETPEKYLAQAAYVKDFTPAQGGVVTQMNAFDIGIGLIELGGGRRVPTDKIDYSVGLTNMAQIGDKVGAGVKPLATIHAKSENDWQKMAAVLEGCVVVGDKAAETTDVIKEKVIG